MKQTTHAWLKTVRDRVQGLGARLTAVFLMLSLIPLAIAGFVAYDSGRRTIEQNTVNHLSSVTILKEAQLERWIEDGQRSLQGLARRPLVRDYATVMASHEQGDPEYQAASTRVYRDHLAISAPVVDGEGNLLAVLAGRVDLTEMSQIMGQASGSSATEESYLVNKFNFFVTESRFEPDYALRKTLHTEGVDACLQGKNGTGAYDDYRGVPVIGSYRWIP